MDHQDRYARRNRILLAVTIGGLLLHGAARAQDADSAILRCYQPDRGYQQHAAYASMRRYQPDRAYSANAQFSANARFRPVAHFEARKALTVHEVQTTRRGPDGTPKAAPSGWFDAQATEHRSRPDVLDNLRAWNDLESKGRVAALREAIGIQDPADKTAVARADAATALLRWESALDAVEAAPPTTLAHASLQRAADRAGTLAHRAVVTVTTLESRPDPSGKSRKTLSWAAIEGDLSRRAIARS